MTIIKIDKNYIDDLAPLVVEFRKTLRLLKGDKSSINIEDAKDELVYYFDKEYPIYVATDDEKIVGYVICRIDDDILWVEQFYVIDEYRRKGIGNLLFDEAEKLANELGQDTAYNYVHPNNETMISFLASRGYTVLNLIEIRKPYKNEQLNTKIKVDKNLFDY